MEFFGEIIARLLVKHNCVIIPNFGGFVARISPAEVDLTKGIIYPPKKSILFNQQLSTSDGLLISEFALNNEISFSEASEKITKIVSLWNEELDFGKKVLISKVGELQRNDNGNLIFTQDRFFNLLLSSYGLGQVKFVPVLEENISNESTQIESTKKEKTLIERADEEVDISIIDHPAINKSGKKWKFALAAACILPIAFYSFWIPVKTNVIESGVFSLQDFNPFSNSPASTYKNHPIDLGEKLFTEKTLEDQINELSSDVYQYSYEFDESLYLTIKLKDQKSEEGSKNEILPTIIPINEQPVIIETPTSLSPQPINQIQSTSLSNADSDIQYEGVKNDTKYAIVGCFSDVKNARNYVSQLTKDGFDAKFLDFHNGLYRISLESSNSIDSLQNTIQRATQKGYSTWILK